MVSFYRGCCLACALGLASIAFGVAQMYNPASPPPPGMHSHPGVSAPSARPALSQKPKGLPNFGPVAPGIYRGAAPTPQGLATLKSMNIHTIIDLRSAKQAKEEKARATAMGFTWINLPMGADPPTSKQVATFLATLAKAPREQVYVHCQYGADRTGCMVGIYRVSVQGWSFPRAWEEMRHYGFHPKWAKLTDAVKSRAKTTPSPKATKDEHGGAARGEEIIA